MWIPSQVRFELKVKFTNTGFTLLETLVAMMILAICLVTIMELLSGGLRTGKVSSDYTTAVFHAKAKMEEILLSKQLISGVWEGKYEDGYFWKVRIDDVTPSEPNQTPTNKLFIVRVLVSWNEGDRKRDYELSTVIIGESIKTGKNE